MTNQQHPLTPPPELMQQWVTEAHSKDAPPGTCPNTRIIINRALEWAAEAELQACCDVIYIHEGQPLCGGTAEWLRAARRPKPLSLAEQALAQLASLRAYLRVHGIVPNADIIRCALERLQELEEGNE